jgi:hypothetical protein
MTDPKEVLRFIAEKQSEKDARRRERELRERELRDEQPVEDGAFFPSDSTATLQHPAQRVREVLQCCTASSTR